MDTTNSQGMHGGDGEDVDRSFLASMIDHHQGAIEMTDASRESLSSEVAALADRIKADQSREIERFRGWLREWYGVDETPSLSPESQEMVKMLERAGPREAPREYLAMMIQHHRKAVVDARAAVQHIEHDPLREAARMMIETQTREQEEMRGLLDAMPQAAEMTSP